MRRDSTINWKINWKKTLLTSEEIKEKLINKGIPFEECKDERGADKTSRKQRCGDCYRKI